MLAPLLTFEGRYYCRQLTFQVAAILFFALGMAMTRGSYGGDEVHKNSPFAITMGISLLSLLLVFVTTLLTANAVLRDREHRMEELLYTTSITKFPYLFARFAGLVLTSFLILCFAVLGMLLGSAFIDPAQAGPLRLSDYLWPLLQFGLPNTLFNAVVLFGTAILTRHTATTYVIGVGMYILYMVASLLGGSPLMASSAMKGPQNDWLPIVLDPYGLVGFFGETRFWSPFERNTQQFSMKGFFLLNRLLWIGFSLLVVTGTYRLASFQLLVRSPKRKPAKPTNPDRQPIPYRPRMPRTESFSAQLAMLFSQTRLTLKLLFKSVPVLVMLLLWVFLVGIELTETLFNGPFGISFYPTTGLVVNLIRECKPALGILLFYSAEVCWLERNSHMDALIDATPVSNGVLFLSKGLTMAGLVGLLVMLNCGIGMVLQLSHGYTDWEPTVYLSLLYYSGAPLFLMGLLMVFVQTLVPHKYLGLLSAGVALLLLLFSERLGIVHGLLRYAKMPDLQYSAMSGFGHYARSFHWYVGYWGAFAGLLSVLSVGLWQRGPLVSLPQRLTRMVRAWGRGATLGASGCLLGLLLSGVYIFHQTHLVHTYRTEEEALDWQAEYEKKYQSYASLPQPTITEVKTEVDLYPQLQQYRVKGRYRLVNQTSRPIRNILVGLESETRLIGISLTNATLTQWDARFQQAWFALKQPLQPGEQLQMQFSLEGNRSGFTAFNKENAVVENGSYIELEKYVPWIGYAQHLELQDAWERRKRGLQAVKATLPTPTVRATYDWVGYETIVSTSAKQQVVTVGELKRQWQRNGRRYFHYKTAQPIAFAFAIASATYQVAKENYKGVEIKVCYQPGQQYNVPAMMQAAKNSLEEYGQHFGPYRHRQLTFAEIPHYRGAATAYPGTIFAAEGLVFLIDSRKARSIDHAYAISAHEVAHQWWAHQLEPAPKPGHKVLTESLAEYAEMRLLEKKYGKAGLRTYRLAQLEHYLTARGYADQAELPLYLAEDQPHVYYQKGGLAMYSLQEMLGEDSLILALRRLLQAHSYPLAPATTSDLLAQLYKVSPDSLHSRIDEWFKKRIFYDLKIDSATYRPLADGRYEVRLKVRIRKNEVVGSSTMRPMAIHEQFEVGLFRQRSEQATGPENVLYQKQHWFLRSVTHLSIVVNQEPTEVALDPEGACIVINRSATRKQLIRKQPEK